jgi:sulfofructose kinase
MVFSRKKPTHWVDDADVVLIDNRFPSFVTPICRAAQARKIPIVIDFDLKTTIDDPLLKLGSHMIASAEALRATTGLADLGAGLAKMATAISGFLAVTDGPNGVFWLENGAMRRLPAFSVTTVDTLAAAIFSTRALRWRWRRGAIWSARYALPAPPPR